MRTVADTSRFLAVLLTAVLLPACKRQSDAVAPKPAAEPAAGESAPAPEPAAKLLDACKIKMTAPEAHEWKTFWDPAHTQTAGKNPSRVSSFHWANAAEQKSANEMHVAVPFELGCSSDKSVKPSIAFNIVTYDSKVTDVPMAPGTYPIAAKAGPGKNKPGQFIVGGLGLIFGDSMFEGKSGTLKLERFDAEGAKGSFTIDGNEILTGSRPLHIEGTFDIPCRKGLLQSACKSDKAEPPK